MSNNLSKCNQDANLAVTSTLLQKNKMLYWTSYAPTQELHKGQFYRRFCFIFIWQIVEASMMIALLLIMRGTRYWPTITENDDTHFQQEIDNFVQWCDQNYPELNVCKTVVNSVWRLGNDNTTIIKCDILAVCCRLPCPTHVLHSHRNDCYCDGLVWRRLDVAS